jgi:NAD-dependent dihydropyrimidine dehydrogenase PreA subunit
MELAQLFENYYRQAYPQMIATAPSVHRVIPVNETVKTGMEIRPYESAAEIVNRAKAWGSTDCICRVQKALIGQACNHPVDVCMVFSDTPGAFDQSDQVKALNQEGALATLRRAAEAGLVHTVSNNQDGRWYICNCCTCSCGVLRGIAELGMANVVARSAFINQVDEDRCGACNACVDACQFGAITVEMVALVNEIRCVGCGVCVVACPDNALALIRRAGETAPPETEHDWRILRAVTRGLDLSKVT